MKKISLIFKSDAEADTWLLCLRREVPGGLMTMTKAATIKVSTRKVKKGKAV